MAGWLLRSVGGLVLSLVVTLSSVISATGAVTPHAKGATKPGTTHVHSHAPRTPARKAGAGAATHGAKHQSGTASAHARTSHSRITRSEATKRSFMKQSGFPHGRPGYVVDHIVPLACGGKDEPSNMQWQTVGAGKAKDKTERRGCR